MDNCFPSVKVLRGVYSSDSRHSTINFAPIPVGEEVTEQMSLATTDTASTVHHRTWASKRSHISPSSLSPSSISSSRKALSSLVSTSFPSTRNYSAKRLLDAHNSCTNSPYLGEQRRLCNLQSLSSPFPCYHFKTLAHQQLRAVSVGHLGCLIRAAKRPSPGFGRVKSLGNLSTKEPHWNRMLLRGPGTGGGRIQLHSRVFTNEGENEWESVHASDITAAFNPFEWWMDERAVVSGVNRRATFNLGDSSEAESSFVDNNKQCSAGQLFLPGRSNFEDELIRETAQFELCEFIIGEMEFLNSIQLLRETYMEFDAPDIHTLNSRISNTATAVSPPPISFQRSVLQQSLLNTCTAPKVPIHRNLSFPPSQPPIPPANHHFSFTDLFGAIQDGGLLDDEPFQAQASEILEDFNSLGRVDTERPGDPSSYPDDSLQSRFVTTLAADMITHCMEMYVGHSEQMAFLKDLHQLFMQTCDADWVFDEPIWDVFTRPKDSHPRRMYRSPAPLKSTVLFGSFAGLSHNSVDSDPEGYPQRNRRRAHSVAVIVRTHRNPSTPVKPSSSPTQHLSPTSESMIMTPACGASTQPSRTAFELRTNFFAPPSLQPEPSRSNSTTALCSPLPYILLLRPPVPNSKRRSILLAQRNRCAGCGVFVETRYLRRMRFCEFFGRFFCCVCHSNTLMVLPGNVLNNWDFRMVPVSNIARDRLKQLHRQPLLRLSEFSPRVRQTQTALRNCSVLRKQGNAILPFVRFCPNARDLLSNLAQLPSHWLETPDLWSVADLCAVLSGQLDMHLRGTLQPVVDHLSTCSRCRLQGFICEVCHSGQILFPFGQANTVSCVMCNACFHRSCLRNPRQDNCPRCLRRAQRRKRHPTHALLLNSCDSDGEHMLSRNT
ncbi:unnamed protein product [Dicrocoelium dendriticum]|nr:unnamed protein product [Dicrocoelium dendriticum]